MDKPFGTAEKSRDGTLERIDNFERHTRRRMLSELWLLIAVIFAGVGILSKQRTLLVAPLLFLTVLGVARVWERNVFRSITYRRVLSPRRAFIGETIELAVELDNRKLLPVGWLCLSEILPGGLRLVKSQLLSEARTQANELYDVFAMRWYERVRKRYTVRCTQRGYFRLGPARFTSGDMFGIFKTQAIDRHHDWLIVYPKVYPLEALGLPMTDPFGDFEAQQRIFEDPLHVIGVRDYQHGDTFRRIHWKASARRQNLQSKVYESTASHNLVFFLNIAIFDQPWKGTIPDVLERLISVTASLANYAIEQRYAAGVVVNSGVPNSEQNIKVPPGRSPQQLTRILEALAAVTPVANASIERLITAESPKLPQGATLVLVTAMVSEPLAATLLHLSQAGRRVVLITLADSLPDPMLYQSVLTYHLPADDLAFSRMLPSEEAVA